MTANITSLFALFIGMFIIYNTFSIAVTQRRTEIGILRALGATVRNPSVVPVRKRHARNCRNRAGIGFGILIARGMAGQVGSFLGEIYGVAQKAEGITADPRLLALAFLIGVSTSVIAAWIPARDAARVDPVQALQKGKHQVLTEGENRIRRTLAIVTALLAAICLIMGLHNRALFYMGFMLTVFSALLITPTACIFLGEGTQTHRAGDPSCGGDTRHRQSDSGSAANFRSSRGFDAVPCAGYLARRNGESELARAFAPGSTSRSIPTSS